MHDKNPASQHLELSVQHRLLWWHLNSKNLRNPLLSALLCTELVGFALRWLCSMPVAFLSEYHPRLESLISLGLPCSVGVTSAAPCSAISGTPCPESDPATHCPASVAFSNLDASFHGPFALLLSASKPVLCRWWHQVQLTELWLGPLVPQL